MKNTILVFLFGLLGLTACGPDYLFDETQKIADGQWGYADTLDFTFEIRDTGAVYNLYIDLEHIDTFKFQNVYLKLYTLFPNGKRLSTVRSFDLYDAAGAGLGKCSGHNCQVRFVLQQNAYFNQAGKYRLTLEQYTRQESLPGVRAVGLMVEQTEQRR